VGTWTYDLVNNTWSFMYNEISPHVTRSFVMAYDSAHGTVVLVGRGEYNQYQTWTYKTGKANWTQMNTNGSTPVHTWAAMAYDTAAGEMVLFDGRCMWTYNQNSNSWKNRFPGNAAPAITGASMVYDSRNDQMVLFGGQDAGYAVLDETWKYNLSFNLWMNVETLAAPPGRYSHSMVYDDKEGEVILFGGLQDEIHDPYLKSDTWVLGLDGTVDWGAYTSAPFDTGGKAFFGALGWSSQTPQNTSVKLRLRTATTANDLMTSFFTGPDGTERTYYESNGQAVNGAHNGSRWVQYRAVLQSKQPPISPVLNSVTVNYNILQTLNITSPREGNNWTGIQNICWSANDMDNDSLSFDIFLESDSSSIALASGLPDGSRQWSWNTAASPSGIYRIRITARDDDPKIPLAVNATSGDFRIWHNAGPPNRLPHVTLVSPANNSFLPTNKVRLHWTGSDPDGDSLTYAVRYSDRPFSQGTILSNITAAAYLDLADLTDNRTYLWTVDASDGRSNGTDVPTEIWSFTVTVLDTPIPPPIAPRCTIDSPANGSKITGTLQLRGTAVNGSLPLSAVFIRIDGGNWSRAVGLENWILAVDIARLPAGRHRAEARAFDGSLYSGTASVDFAVFKPEPGVTTGGNPWCLPAIMVAAVAGVSVVILLKKKKWGRY